ncbi:MAG: DUF4255 domain-containing protein [Exilibacterium sp.]
MIDGVLVFLKNRLNSHFNALSGLSLDDGGEDRVVFIDGETLDPISFKLEAVTVLLMNIEEEKILRPADFHSRINESGSSERANPEIRLNLYVLFVSRFKQYERGLNYLSLIVKYFQVNRVFNRQNSPELTGAINQLNVELITLPFSEQNEIWNALRTTYHPSLLYKVKMVVYSDENAVEMPAVCETDMSVQERSPPADTDS